MPRTPSAARRLLLVAATISVAGASFAGPIAGDRLVLKRNGTSARFAFSSVDPSWLLPQPPGGDNGPGAIRIEIVSPAESSVAELNVPALAAPAVWQATPAADGSIRRYRYRNSGAPNPFGDLKSAQLQLGGKLKLNGPIVPLALTSPQGQIALRITLSNVAGSQVLCALFRGADIATDRAGAFLGRGAPASNLADCSDAALGITHPCAADPNLFACVGECPAGQTCVVDNPLVPSCHCVGPNQPCGDTAPACNGTCPSGESCVVTQSGTLGSECACIPPGGCGYVQQCGGSCPAGESCYAYSETAGQFISYSGCRCDDPTPCNCNGGIACPAGTSCRVQQVPNICLASCQ
jgi:hypothetical protein